jgi:hypothetical protein
MPGTAEAFIIHRLEMARDLAEQEGTEHARHVAEQFQEVIDLLDEEEGDKALENGEKALEKYKAIDLGSREKYVPEDTLSTMFMLQRSYEAIKEMKTPLGTVRVRPVDVMGNLSEGEDTSDDDGGDEDDKETKRRGDESPISEGE